MKNIINIKSGNLFFVENYLNNSIGFPDSHSGGQNLYEKDYRRITLRSIYNPYTKEYENKIILPKQIDSEIKSNLIKLATQSFEKNWRRLNSKK